MPTITIYFSVKEYDEVRNKFSDFGELKTFIMKQVKEKKKWNQRQTTQQQEELYVLPVTTGMTSSTL